MEFQLPLPEIHPSFFIVIFVLIVVRLILEIKALWQQTKTTFSELLFWIIMLAGLTALYAMISGVTARALLGVAMIGIFDQFWRQFKELRHSS